jgi:mono/diheme cytochrome c family protein
LLSAYVVRRTYVDLSAASELKSLESIWAWLLIAALGWAIVNLYWSLQSVRNLSAKGFYNHFAITIGCGLVAIGIQAVMFARSFTMQPLVLDYSGSDHGSRQVQSTASVSSAASIAGDAAVGQKIFSTTCVTCHGPAGGGLPNLAPSLLGSPFIKSSDDATVANTIRLGRALGEPNNKSGKVMPAKGGNPFLTEEQIAHLVAFVRSVQSGGPIAAAGGDTVPTIQLAKWVVPKATEPAIGFDSQVIDAEDRAGTARVARHAARREVLMQRLTLALTGTHSVFLLGVVVLSSNLLLPKLLTGNHASNPLLGKLSTVGWLIAAGAWILVAWLCF